MGSFYDSSDSDYDYYTRRTPTLSSSNIGGVEVTLHAANLSPVSFIGQRLFDTLSWKDLVRVIPKKSVASAADLYELQKYLGASCLGRTEHVRAVEFKLETEIGYFSVTALVVPDLKSNSLILGKDFFRMYSATQIEFHTSGNRLVFADGAKIMCRGGAFMVIPGHPSAKCFDFVIDVFTDGACVHNGLFSARAAFAAVFPAFPNLSVSGLLPAHALQTSNRAEYTAVQRALRVAASIDPEGNRELRIHTDSELLINSLTLWVEGWRYNGWRKANGDPVMNVDLLTSIKALMNNRSRAVKFVHVAAHTGRGDWESRWNDKADKLARQVLY